MSIIGLVVDMGEEAYQTKSGFLLALGVNKVTMLCFVPIQAQDLRLVD